MRNLLIPAAATTLLLTTAACDPATLGMAAAGMVLDAVTETPTQIAEQAPNIMEALSGLDDSVSENCLAMIDGRSGDTQAKDVDVETRSGNSSVPLTAAAEVDETEAVDDAGYAQTVVDPAESTAITMSAITMSSQTEKVCTIQPVCLPGNSYPVEMMMCSETEVTTAQADNGVDAELDVSQQPTTVNWAWNEGDVVTSP